VPTRSDPQRLTAPNFPPLAPPTHDCAMSARVWCHPLQVLNKACACTSSFQAYVAASSNATGDTGSEATPASAPQADDATEASTSTGLTNEGSVRPGALYLWRNVGVLPWLVALCEPSTTPFQLFADALHLARSVLDAAIGFHTMSLTADTRGSSNDASARLRVAAIGRDFGATGASLLSAAVAKAQSTDDAEETWTSLVFPAVQFVQVVQAFLRRHSAPSITQGQRKRGQEEQAGVAEVDGEGEAASMRALLHGCCPADVVGQLITLARAQGSQACNGVVAQVLSSWLHSAPSACPTSIHVRAVLFIATTVEHALLARASAGTSLSLSLRLASAALRDVVGFFQSAPFVTQGPLSLIPCLQHLCVTISTQVHGRCVSAFGGEWPATSNREQLESLAACAADVATLLQRSCSSSLARAAVGLGEVDEGVFASADEEVSTGAGLTLGEQRTGLRVDAVGDGDQDLEEEGEDEEEAADAPSATTTYTARVFAAICLANDEPQAASDAGTAIGLGDGNGSEEGADHGTTTTEDKKQEKKEKKAKKVKKAKKKRRRGSEPDAAAPVTPAAPKRAKRVAKTAVKSHKKKKKGSKKHKSRAVTP